VDAQNVRTLTRDNVTTDGLWEERGVGKEQRSVVSGQRSASWHVLSELTRVVRYALVWQGRSE